MKIVGLIAAWIVSLLAIAVGVLVLGAYFSSASQGFPAPGLDSDHAREIDLAVKRSMWGVGAGALVFGALANPLLLRWVPGLGHYWVRLLLALALGVGCVLAAGFLAGAHRYPLL